MKTIYLKRTISNRCPRCGEGNVLTHPFKRLDGCSVCEMKYEREQGFFLGGVPVSYFLICSLWVLPIITLWFLGWFSLEWMLGLCIGGGRGVSGSFVSLLPGSLVGVVLLLRLA